MFRQASGLLLLSLLFLAHSSQAAGRTEYAGPDAVVEQLGFPKGITPQEARSKLSSLLPHALDGRVPLAAQAISELLGGPGGSQVAVTRQAGGGWFLKLGEQEVGVLPEFPDFSEIMDLLQKWATHLKAEKPLTPASLPAEEIQKIEAGIRRFHLADQILTARSLEEHWSAGRRSPVFFKWMSQLLAHLALQAYDLSDFLDPLHSQLLASLALARAFEQEADPKTEILIAWLLGYTRHAVEKARALPERDFLRLFVSRENAILQDIGLKEGLTPFEQHLVLRSFAGPEDAKKWLDFVKRIAPEDPQALFGITVSSLQVSSFDLQNVRAQVPTLEDRLLVNLPPRADSTSKSGRFFEKSAIKLAIWGRGALVWLGTMGLSKFPRVVIFLDRPMASCLEPSLSKLVGQFEGRLRELASGPPTGLFSGRLEASLFHGLFYSALADRGRFLQRQLVSIPAAKSFAAELKDAGSPSSLALSRWLEALIEPHVRMEESHRGQMAYEAIKTGPFRGALRDELFHTLAHSVHSLDPVIKIGAVQMLKKVDSRPTGRGTVASLVCGALGYLNACGKAYSDFLKVRDEEGSGELIAWFGRFEGDEDRLAAYMKDPKFAVNAKAEILQDWMDRNTMPVWRMKSLLQDSVYVNPESFALRLIQHTYLLMQGDIAGSIKAGKAWVTYLQQNSLGGLDLAEAQTRLARSYRWAGEYQKALEILEPLLETFKETTVIEAIANYGITAKADKVEELSKTAIERYPSSGLLRAVSMLSFLKVGKIPEAARTFAPPLRLNPDQSWLEAFTRWLSRPDFKVLSDEALLETVRQIRKSNLEPGLVMLLAHAIAKARGDQLAFKLITENRGGTPRDQADDVAAAFVRLSRFAGVPKALEWARAQTKDAKVLGLLAWATDHPELIWNLIPEPDSIGELGMDFWLRRAILEMKDGFRNPGRRDILLKRFERNRSDPYCVMGLYLLGRIKDQELLDLIGGRWGRLAEISYYIGLKAQKAGRFEEAADWFLWSTLSPASGKMEYQSALTELLSWAKVPAGPKRLRIEYLRKVVGSVQ